MALDKSTDDPKRIPTLEQLPDGALGLALSGGGIRSATLSLGLVQGFSRYDRLFDFDYLSTVSGGGYFGCFLSSLFVPGERRGQLKRDENPSATDEKDSALNKALRKFVEDVLDSDANEETINGPSDSDAIKGSTSSAHGTSNEQDLKSTRMRNPIWWLREHGRYLAPNGPTDYMYATAI